MSLTLVVFTNQVRTNNMGQIRHGFR